MFNVKKTKTPDLEEEIHLFVIWEKGRYAEREILEDIRAEFEIIQTFAITWSPYMVNKNYSRFYDAKLPINSQKEVYAGVGEFKLIVIRDSKPAYDLRNTSNGEMLVNTRMFDAKTRYRELTGGGHKIHGTNDLCELKHDLVLLLGVSLSDFLKAYDNPEQHKQEIVLQQDLPGSNGWQTFEELFYVLNECDEYIVLRNSCSLSLQHFKENDGDIDLLVRNRKQCQYILGDLSCIEADHKVDSSVSVDNQIIPFEIYEAGENLFDEKYEEYLFQNKFKMDTFFCLPPKIELYTLVYHAIMFHKKISNKHLRRIEKNPLLNEVLKGGSVTEENLFLSLLQFFERIGCNFIAPNDEKIYFNFSLAAGRNLVVNKKRPNILKANMRKIFRFQKLDRFYKISLFTFLDNHVELVFAFRLRFIRVEIRLCLGAKPRYRGF